MGACVSTRPIPRIFFEPTPAIGLVNFNWEELGHAGPTRVKTEWILIFIFLYVCLDTLYSMVALFENYRVGI